MLCIKILKGHVPTGTEAINLIVLYEVGSFQNLESKSAVKKNASQKLCKINFKNMISRILELIKLSSVCFNSNYENKNGSCQNHKILLFFWLKC